MYFSESIHPVSFQTVQPDQGFLFLAASHPAGSIAAWTWPCQSLGTCLLRSKSIQPPPEHHQKTIIDIDQTTAESLVFFKHLQALGFLCWTPSDQWVHKVFPEPQNALKSADCTLSGETQWTLWSERCGHFAKKQVATFGITPTLISLLWFVKIWERNGLLTYPFLRWYLLLPLR